MKNRSDIVVIGGGITGLCIAYLAAKSGKTVTVLESGDRFGGLLDTFEVGGTHLEKFYHHFFLQDRELHWLLSELNLADKAVYRESKMGVYSGGKIYNFSTLKDLFSFSPLSLLDKVRFGITSFFLATFYNWKRHENQAAYAWLKSWSGKNVTRTIWGPLLRIKFGNYFSKVPLAWMIGRLGQRLKSRNGGKEMLGYLDGSLKVLCDKLILSLESLEVKLHNLTPATELIYKNGVVCGVVAGQNRFEAETVIPTVPNQIIAALTNPIDTDLATELKKVEYFGAVCTVLELSKPLSNVYWLNMADTDFPFGGVIEQTNLLNPERYNDIHIAYLSRYFAKDEIIATMSEDDLKKIMLDGVRRAFPDFDEKNLLNVHVFRTNTAATVCDLNFSAKVNNCKSKIEGLVIANMIHVYPDERSVNNAIRVAANVCQSLGMDCSYIPRGNSLAGKIGFD